MRKLTTPLTLLSILIPASAFAQATPEESPEAEAPAEAALEQPAPAEGPEAPPLTAGGPEAQPVVLEDAGAGLAAGASTTAGPTAVEPAAEAAPTSRPSPSRSTYGGGGGDKWEFSYNGYLRAPMRWGIANNTGPQHVAEGNRSSDFDNPDGQVVNHEQAPDGTWAATGLQDKKMTIHRPVVPDDQYSSWQFTSHNRNSWAEMFFSVGTAHVAGVLAIQGFQFTDSAWVQEGAQFGIGQGYVDINHDLGFDNVKFSAKVGSHWARYGRAGVYDAGEYDTYLFGRTHTMGATTRLDFILSSFDLAIEGGFGGKQPDPRMYNRARYTTMAHGHAFLKFPSVEFGAHALHAWASASTASHYPGVLPGSGGCDPESPGTQCTIAPGQIAAADGTELYGGVDGPLGVFGPEYPTGKQTIVGADARMDLGLFGYLYAGYSYQMLSNALTVDNAIESIHSLGAGNFRLGVVDNYLESPYCLTASAPNESCSNGDGAIGTVLFQYELGLANFGILPGSMDLRTKLYGMFNHVSVDDIEEQRLLDQWELLLPTSQKTVNDLRQDGTTKIKFGADMEFFPLDWMSAGVRFDRLDPHSKLKNEGFSILSPRLSFRTKMVTHETITLQYSRYFYDRRQCQDAAGNVASPADDPFRPNGTSLYNQPNTDPGEGFPLRLECTQPAPSSPPPDGFGAHPNNQTPGNKGAATLIPDENLISLTATMWW